MSKEVAFNRWLKLRRTALDLTQWDLAERVGCSREAIQKIEAGTRRPSKQIAELLIACLEIPPEERPAFVRWARLGPGAAPPDLALASALTPSTATTPVESVESAPPSNLPAPLTSLIGRDEELEAARRSLLRDEVRLLTLVGPPGIGKTRLSIAVAARLSVQFRDGVYFVALDTVNDTQLVLAAIGKSLGLKPSEKQPMAKAVAGYLRDKQLLLVLDNFEQVLDAGPEVIQLLGVCPGLKALVTSREPLHAYGECRFQVPPLELPDRKRLPDLDVLAGLASVILFLQRAQARKPDLALTPANAGTIAAICLHLDGLPLAIELAAARIEDFAPEQILAGLGDRLKLLKGDLRYLPLRQQTLRGAIDWSYHLLTIGERTLFRRLGVFVGGCSLAATQAVCNANRDLPFEVQAGVSALVNKSLMHREVGRDGELRWGMLESIREYALKRLTEAGEAETLRARHAAFFAGYLEERFDLILSREQDRVIQEIDTDIGNVRAAWDWALAARRQDLIRQSSQGLLCYYEMQSGFSEVEAACARAMATLTDDPHVDPVLLAVLRSYHGYALGRLGRLSSARTELEQGCAELRQADARAESALPLIMLGTVAWQEGDYAGARPLLEESLRISRAMGNTFCTALAVFFLGLVAHASGDYGQAGESFREALRLARIHGQPRLISMISVSSSPTLLALGQHTEARERLQEGLALARASRIRWLVGVAQGQLGLVLNAQGDHAGARMALLEAVASAQESGNQWDRAWEEVCLGDAELGLRNQGQASAHYCLGLQLATEEHALSIALDALAGLALLRAQAGDRESALELAGHVSLHPASSGIARTRANQVHRILNADSQGKPIGVAGTFEEIVQRILSGVS